MRRRIQYYLMRAARWLQPKPQQQPNQTPIPKQIVDVVRAAYESQDVERQQYRARVHELHEARQMTGAGPWLVAEARGAVNGSNLAGKLRESNPILAQGAYGDIELALQNVDWRREINFAWLEFSRWGIQQIILISRLYYIKNPLIRRLINVCAIYVFGRGFEVSSPDPDANDQIKRFFERNTKVLGQIALTEHERRKAYDGNLFFALFPALDTDGELDVRMIDATEIQDIITDPEDATRHWYYRRLWTARVFDTATGSTMLQDQERYYPALGYDPASKPATINAVPVEWTARVHHRASGKVGQWLFGCPPIYPAIDWARATRDLLTAIANVKQALSKYAMTFKTKGGAPAIANAKDMLATTSTPGGDIWDSNPPAISASTFVSDMAGNLEPFNVSNAGGNPEECRQYKLMCCMCMDVPETFLADVSTGNLATATTLDRPTELAFRAKQEEWIEDLVILTQEALKTSVRAPKGKLREALVRRGATLEDFERIQIGESGRMKRNDGTWVYEVAKPSTSALEVQASFPAIREGDNKMLIDGLVQALTLGNKGGQIIGIDEKEGVRLLCKVVGVDKPDELVDAMYPEGEYEPDRTKEIVPPPISKAVLPAGGQPQIGPDGQPTNQAPPPRKDMEEALARVSKALKIWEASHEHAGNGRAG